MGQKKTMKLMMNKVVMKTVKRTSSLKSIDVDKTFAVISVVGKSISHRKN